MAYIRKEFGDYFCIGVAGYPETHLESTSVEQDIRDLKHKVDQGADLSLEERIFWRPQDVMIKDS